MSQVGWVFLDQSGGRHRVGLYHGDSSGHVLIHVNYKAVQVDFSVKESKSYSFFINDEFVEVRIFKEKAGFSYEFFVNKTVDTPLNRERKRLFRHDMKWTLGVSALVVVVIAVGSFFLIRHNYQQAAVRMAATGFSFAIDNNNLQKLGAGGKKADAVVYRHSNSPEKAYYRFITDDSTVVSGEMHFKASDPVLLPTGFPLRDGDAFLVFYLPSNPKVFFLDFSQPKEATVAGYVQLAVEAELRARPGLSKQKARCLANITLQEKGWEKLGFLIFQEADLSENKKYNRDGYLKMIRESEFAKSIKTYCWNK